MFYTVIRTIILHIKVQYFSKYRDARFIDVKQKYTTRVLYYGSVVYNKNPQKNFILQRSLFVSQSQKGRY